MPVPTVTLACSDGAIRGGYVAGVFYGLKEHLPALWDYVKVTTASSASVGGVLYEVALGARNPGQHLWTEAFADPNLIRLSNLFKGKPIYDIDYLVDTIFTQNNPCILPSLSTWPYEVFFPLIDSHSGATVVFNTRIALPYNPATNTEYVLVQEANLYQYIRAACAALILYNQPVAIDGRSFIDAGFRFPFYLNDPHIKTSHTIILSTTRQRSWFTYWALRGFRTAYLLMTQTCKLPIKRALYAELGNDYLAYQDFFQKQNKPGQPKTYYLYAPFLQRHVIPFFLERLEVLKE